MSHHNAHYQSYKNAPTAIFRNRKSIVEFDANFEAGGVDVLDVVVVPIGIGVGVVAVRLVARTISTRLPLGL